MIRTWVITTSPSVKNIQAGLFEILRSSKRELTLPNNVTLFTSAHARSYSSSLLHTSVISIKRGRMIRPQKRIARKIVQFRPSHGLPCMQQGIWDVVLLARHCTYIVLQALQQDTSSCQRTKASIPSEGARRRKERKRPNKMKHLEWAEQKTIYNDQHVWKLRKQFLTRSALPTVLKLYQELAE